jgi:Zn-dependent protease with chaperone function
MKININQDGQILGPFSREELQEKLYSGELSRGISACIEGGTEWVPLDSLLSRPSAPAPSVVPLASGSELERLRDSKEKTALVWLYLASIPVWLVIIALVISSLGTILIFAGVAWLAVAVGEMFYAAHLKTNAVRVSETQLPELHRAVLASCEKLGMACPDVYVLQHNVWNAFATKIFGRRMVVLFSGAVDSILLKGDLQQLSWVVGHELGHHWAGHLNFSRKLAKLGGWFIWVEFWYSRRRELTCDRVGLYCAGSLKSSQLALANLTTGAQFANRVNLEAVAAQWRQHRSEFFVKYRTFYSTYPPLLARMEYLSQAAQELGIG